MGITYRYDDVEEARRRLVAYASLTPAERRRLRWDQQERRRQRHVALRQLWAAIGLLLLLLALPACLIWLH